MQRGGGQGLVFVFDLDVFFVQICLNIFIFGIDIGKSPLPYLKHNKKYKAPQYESIHRILTVTFKSYYNKNQGQKNI